GTVCASAFLPHPCCTSPLARHRRADQHARSAAAHGSAVAWANSMDAARARAICVALRATRESEGDLIVMRLELAAAVVAPLLAAACAPQPQPVAAAPAEQRPPGPEYEAALHAL